MRLLQLLPQIFKSKFGVLIAVLISLWPIIAGVEMLKWDIVDIHLPWKFFITSCANSGIIPTWNPYTQGGFPQMIDPGTWYPVSYFLGWFGGYNLNSLHLEFILHLLLASWGMQWLLQEYSISQKWRTALAICYALSGFVAGNAQHSGWIYAYAYLPILVGLLKLWLRELNTKTALLLSLSLALFVGAAYPGAVIITAYILLAYGISGLLKLNFFEKSMMWQPLLMIVIVATLLSPFLVSLFLLSNDLNRTQSISIDQALIGSVNPWS